MTSITIFAIAGAKNVIAGEIFIMGGFQIVIKERVLFFVI